MNNNEIFDMPDFLDAPKGWLKSDELIKVIGVGGGGCNAVDHMFKSGVTGCSFIACNTDSQCLDNCSVATKIQLGAGRGAGTDPIKGRNAALEKLSEIEEVCFTPDTQMVFITTGLGGGTGTGAAPVIAKAAKDKGLLTVGVVTLPFEYEGKDVRSRAIEGVHEMEKFVDSLLVINNDKLYKCFGNILAFEGFPKSNDVLLTAVQSIISIIQKPGYINLDMEDVKNMMRSSGMALMGMGEGHGENRLEDAVKGAFESPLLNDFDPATSKKVLMNICVGKNQEGPVLAEMDELNKIIARYTGGHNNFKTGIVFEEDPAFGDTIRVTAIATGFKFDAISTFQYKEGDIIRVSHGDVYEGECLPITSEDYTGNVIGINDPGTKGRFTADRDNIPSVLSKDPEVLARTANVPAIRRKN